MRSIDISDSLWLESQNLSGRINHLKVKLLNDTDDKLDSVQIHKIDMELNEAIIEQHKQKEKTKAVNQYVYFQNNPLIQTIQQNINPNELMLEYFLADSAIYYFVIGQQILELTKEPIGPGFKDSILNYIAGIKKHRFDQFQGESHYLYEKLVKPVEQYLSGKSL